MPSTKKQLDAIALLKADHRKVEELFEKFEKARSETVKQKLAQQVCTELIVHSTIEEEIFYPACQGKIEEDLSNEAYVEHDGAKILIAEILGSDPGNEFFDAKVTVLAEMIEHHVKEEEKPGKGLFAQARSAGLDMDALGDQMAGRKEQLLAEISKKGFPTLETRSFTGHEIEQGAPIGMAG